MSSPVSPCINKQDLLAKSKGYLFGFPKVIDTLILRYCKLKDLPIAYLFLNILITIIPTVFLLFFLGSDNQPLIVAPLVFFANLFFYQERFILALHYSQHRPIFFGALWFLNDVPNIFLSVLYGLPPMGYNLHHVVMHHREDNQAPWDLSSTEIYQRNNFFHWLIYWLRHLLFIVIELPLFGLRRGFAGKAILCFLLSVGYFVSLALLLISPRFRWPALWFGLIPQVLSSALLMFGNWSQHIFVDPTDPRDDYKLTYNCINSRLNRYAFNDGYHITHHIFPGCHWTDLPKQFDAHRQVYADHKAFIFDGLDFFQVGFYVFTGQWKKLARALVHPVTGKPWPEDVAIKEMKRRLAPVDRKATVKN